MMKIKDNFLYLCADKELIKLDLKTLTVISRNTIFPKNGKSRDFIIDQDYIYFREFCTCFKIHANNLSIVNQWKLGQDLSSDICGITSDGTYFYAGLRNGPLATIHKETNEVNYHHVSDASIWTLKIDKYLYGGNVNGELLKIDKQTHKVLQCQSIHKKNLKSLLLTSNQVYTASQDLSVGIIDLATFNCIARIKKCHNKMFYIVGIWKDYLITASPPCGETKLWNIFDYSHYKTIKKATWNMIIKDHDLYILDGSSILCANLNAL